MTRESVAHKATRYLAEARLTVLSVAGDSVTAVCRGTDGVYSLGHQPARGWYCSCPARTGDCCHVLALRLVTDSRAVTEEAATRLAAAVERGKQSLARAAAERQAGITRIGGMP